MARIVGVDIPRNKKIVVSLQYIYGIGHTLSRQILSSSGVDPDTKVRDLTEGEVSRLSDITLF